MLAQEFVRNALIAGTPIALTSGAIGYFVVLRSQVFAGDALTHVAFTGAVAAAAIGIDLRFGLFAATVIVALLLAGVGDRARTDDVAIGVVFVWVLGLGVLLLDAAGGGSIAARTLFGSIFGLGTQATVLAAAIGLALLAALVVVARPLLFATLDPEVAAVRGVRVGLLGTVFLVLLALDAAEATQAVGALLLLGLIAAPAGAAHALTTRPYFALALSAGLALAATWLGVAVAYVFPTMPPSTAIVGAAVVFYAVAMTVGAVRRLPDGSRTPIA
ncbi:MAG TPA: metal ABC transporter permease [Gaiellaceae bacterium]|nr:metal ABC transporter permease [Gaiellaceae bacterium]